MMTDAKLEMFRNRLTKVLRHKSKTANKLGVTCYRLYDHDLPEFPFCIELYEEKVYIAEYERKHKMIEEEHQDWLDASLHAVYDILRVSEDDVYLKLRHRKKGRQGQYQKANDEGNEFVVVENGLKFLINLSDYLDTGLYLDHRITRQMVKDKGAGKKVLNLFAYTGSFSVYAAAGGASIVETVDLSRTYLDWAQRNFLQNGFADKAKYSFVQADVKSYLSGLPTESFDLVIMDPPTFSNSKRTDDFLDIQRDHVSLINECLRILLPGGELYFSTNYRKFILDAEAIKTVVIKDITRTTTPFDFEGKYSRACYYLKK